jgi:hypothetical protein
MTTSSRQVRKTTMSLSQQLNPTLAVQKFEVEIIEAALSYCAALPQQRMPHDSNSPLSASHQDIENLQKALSVAKVAKVEIADEILNDPFMHINLWSIWTFIVPLTEDEMMALDAVLLCYQAHCRMEIAQGAKVPIWAHHDQWIEFIRQRIRVRPPTAA